MLGYQRVIGSLSNRSLGYHLFWKWDFQEPPYGKLPIPIPEESIKIWEWYGKSMGGLA